MSIEHQSSIHIVDLMPNAYFLQADDIGILHGDQLRQGLRILQKIQKVQRHRCSAEGMPWHVRSAQHHKWQPDTA